MTNKQKINNVFALFFASSISIFAPGSEEDSLQNAARPAVAATIVENAALAQTKTPSVKEVKFVGIIEKIRSKGEQIHKNARGFKVFLTKYTDFYFSIEQNDLTIVDKKSEFNELIESYKNFLTETVESFKINYWHLYRIFVELGQQDISKNFEVVSRVFSETAGDDFNFSFNILPFLNSEISLLNQERSPDESFSQFKDFARGRVVNLINFFYYFNQYNMHAEMCFLTAIERKESSFYKVCLEINKFFGHFQTDAADQFNNFMRISDSTIYQLARYLRVDLKRMGNLCYITYQSDDNHMYSLTRYEIY